MIKKNAVAKSSKVNETLMGVSGGATAIEYGLIAAGISVALITVANGLGGKINTAFNGISNGLK